MTTVTLKFLTPYEYIFSAVERTVFCLYLVLHMVSLSTTRLVSLCIIYDTAETS